MISFIANILLKIRNPSFGKILKELKANDSLDYHALESKQIENLRKLLIHAYENSSYYNEKFKNEKVDVYAKDILNEFEKIKLITKEDLIENKQAIITKGHHRFIAKTSGTSGQRLVFPKNEKWDSHNRASIARGYSWHGANFLDLKIYFWGFKFNLIGRVKTRFYDFLANRIRIFTFNERDLKFALKNREKIKIIEGYSSLINRIAEYSIDHKINFPNLKLVKATSETIQKNYIKNVKKAFNLNLVSEYGSAEAGIIAFSCNKNKMHINMESVYIERINDEAVITNLNSYSFPIIKYKQGDSIGKIDYCECDLPFPIIDTVIGRIGQDVHGKNSTYPSLLFYNIFKNVNNTCNTSIGYYIEQHEKGVLQVYIKGEETEFQKTKEHVQREFEKYCAKDMDVVIKIYKSNSTVMNEKTVDFKSFIKL